MVVELQHPRPATGINDAPRLLRLATQQAAECVRRGVALVDLGNDSAGDLFAQSQSVTYANPSFRRGMVRTQPSPCASEARLATPSMIACASRAIVRRARIKMSAPITT